MNKLSQLLVVSFSFLPVLTLHAQWVQTNGPYGGRVNSFAVNGATIFAGTTDGIFRSSDNGAHWNTTGVTADWISCFAIAGRNIYAGSEGYGYIYFSSDNGISWENTTTAFANVAIISLAVSNGYIFCGTGTTSNNGGPSYGGGVHRSSDNGNNWLNMYNGLADSIGVYSFDAIGGNILAGTQYGIYLSSDNGESWHSIGIPNRVVLSLATLGTDIVAGTDSGVFLLNGSGGGWLVLNKSLDSTLIQTIGVLGTNIFVGSDGPGVFLSSDSGNSWTAVNKGLESDIIYSLAVADTNILAGTAGGGYFSTNKGRQWDLLTSGMPQAYVQRLGVSGKNIFAGTNLGAFLSTDNGERWNFIDSGLGEWANSTISSFVFSGGYVFAGIDGGVVRTTNNGAYWDTTGLWGEDVYSLAVSGSNLFAGTWGGGVFLSSDNGVHWTATHDSATFQNDFYYNSALIASGGNLFEAIFGPSIEAVYLSTDAGASWDYAGLDGEYVNAFAVSGANLFAGTWNGVFLSSDNGNHWVAIGLNYIDVYSFAIMDSDIFAGTKSGVFLTTNNGQSWSSVNAGLEDTSVYSLGICDSNLFAATNYGVWRRPLSDFGITAVKENTANSMPLQPALVQNFPNPFSEATAIDFLLSESGHVTLKVYNSLGEEIRTLLDEDQSAGLHSIAFDGRQLQNGMYFYRLTTGKFSQTGKMTVIH
jgi:hypothetical protein